MTQARKPAPGDTPPQDPGLFTYEDTVMWSLSNPTRYLPPQAMDHLLGGIRLSAALPGHADLSAPFGVDIAYGPDTLVMYEAHRGACHVAFDDPVLPVRLSQGDLLVVPCQMRHRISDTPDASCIDLRKLLASQVEPHVTGSCGRPSLARLLSQRVRYGGGGDLFELRMLVIFIDARTSGVLVDGLAEPLHLNGFADIHRDFLETLFGQFDPRGINYFTTQPAAIRLTEALLTLALNEAASTSDTMAIYKGLNDPAIARVIGAVLDAPQRDWKLDDLAEVGHICRSSLCSRFSAAVGMPPRHFVTHIRLSRAHDLLKSTALSIAVISEQSGYGSESAFNRAFKKWCGVTPGAIRDGVGM